MALDGKAMGSAVYAKVIANAQTREGNGEKFWQDICEEIVSHVISNLEVSSKGVTIVSSGSSAGSHPTEVKEIKVT